MSSVVSVTNELDFCTLSHAALATCCLKYLCSFSIGFDRMPLSRAILIPNREAKARDSFAILGGMEPNVWPDGTDKIQPLRFSLRRFRLIGKWGRRCFVHIGQGNCNVRKRRCQ